MNKIACFCASLATVLAAPCAIGFDAQSTSNTVAVFPVGGAMSAPQGSTPISFPLIGECLYEGTIEFASGDTLLAANFQPGSFVGFARRNALDEALYYVEIASGDAEGLILGILGTDDLAGSLTLSHAIEGLAQDGDAFRIRKHTTVADIFDLHNEANLASGSSFQGSDYLEIQSPKLGPSNYLYYQTANPASGGIGWRLFKTGRHADAAEKVIMPDEGVIFRRLQANALVHSVVGDVKSTRHLTPVDSGESFLAYVYPMDVTLDSSNLFTGAGDPLNVLEPMPGPKHLKDYVLMQRGNTVVGSFSYESFYYQIAPAGQGGTGWRSVDTGVFVDRGNTNIPAGRSFIIKKNSVMSVWFQTPPSEVQ